MKVPSLTWGGPCPMAKNRCSGQVLLLVWKCLLATSTHLKWLQAVVIRLQYLIGVAILRSVVLMMVSSRRMHIFALIFRHFQHNGLPGLNLFWRSTRTVQTLLWKRLLGVCLSASFIDHFYPASLPIIDGTCALLLLVSQWEMLSPFPVAYLHEKLFCITYVYFYIGVPRCLKD